MYNYDILVYGTTPSGVLAAVSAAAEGYQVALLDPRSLVGGMISGGLVNTDIGTTTEIFGGRTLKYFQQVYQYYYNNGTLQPSHTLHQSASAMYILEPHVGEYIFYSMINEVKDNLTIYLNTRITSVDIQETIINTPTIRSTNNNTTPSVNTQETIINTTTIRNINNIYTTLNDTVFHGKIILDCTYEGILLPLTNISYTYGREANTTYNESVAGVLPEPHNASTPDHPFTSQPQLPYGINPYWENTTEILPLINTELPNPVGFGDLRTQSYNYRITITNISALKVPFPKPNNYNSSTYELFYRAITIGNWKEGIGLGGMMPSLDSNKRYGKFDVNSQKLDQPGFSWNYPLSIITNNWTMQEEIWELHKDFTLGLLYFMSTDPRLTPEFRAFMQSIGFSNDEFINYDNFPPQLYIREALRLQSDYIFTQYDREINYTKHDSIGMGSYSIDVLHVSRYPDKIYGVLEEGGLQAPSFLPPSLPPFEIPYRIIIPKENEVNNLLVPVAVSASHLGFCAIRLEPTWMIIGESAGIAATIALRYNTTVQNINISLLQNRLQELGQILHFNNTVG